MKKLLTTLFLVISFLNTSFAGIKILNMNIGQSTLEDIKSHYKNIACNSSYLTYKKCIIPISDFGDFGENYMKQDAELYFSKNLQAVNLKLFASEFDELSKKYDTKYSALSKQAWNPPSYWKDVTETNQYEKNYLYKDKDNNVIRMIIPNISRKTFILSEEVYSNSTLYLTFATEDCFNKILNDESTRLLDKEDNITDTL